MLYRNLYICIFTGPNPQPNFLLCLTQLMDNCDNSRNMTSTSMGLQSTGLNWCHFSIVDTKKCHRLEKVRRLKLKIKMFPAPAAEKEALLPYPRGTVYACSSCASNYWEEAELFGY